MSGAAGPEPWLGDGGCCSVDEGCITCGDVAVELVVVSVAGADALCVDADGREETVATELVGTVAAGDRLLVHAKVAIERLGDPDQRTDGTTGDPADALRR